MNKRYCEVQTIDGVETVTNIAVASEAIAMKRGYVEIEGAEMGAQKIGGKWIKPEPVRPKPDKLEALIETLVRKGLITEAEKPNGAIK